ncbi:MAG: uracil phosphoribosyltransferase [Gammaproteobacteria bacterium]|nr:uracil phosphoribosyltransferase [Gammaproteobacteria bacterium]
MTHQVHIIDHPLIQHKLTLMRQADTNSADFRRLLKEISLLLGFEATRDLDMTTRAIETPLETMDAPILAGKKMCLFSILRAGEGLLSGMSELVPSARIGHVGLYRDPETLEAVEYYFKAPTDLANRLCIVVDPMLATGHSASAALTRIKQAGAVNIRFICLLSAPDGIATLKQEHPDVPIFTGALDRECNEKGYILPGLGDAGDRIFGTI